MEGIRHLNTDPDKLSDNSQRQNVTYRTSETDKMEELESHNKQTGLPAQVTLLEINAPYLALLFYP